MSGVLHVCRLDCSAQALCITHATQATVHILPVVCERCCMRMHCDPLIRMLFDMCGKNASRKAMCCCRCVVVLGMPFPNPADPELRERMRYLDMQQHTPHTPSMAAQEDEVQQRGVARPAADAPEPATAGSAAGTSAGREYYEDLCMKAVNQCVGRVIRHAGDWAAILLVDARWGGRACPRPGPGPSTAFQSACDGGRSAPSRVWDGPLGKLPGWIQQSLDVSPSFGDAFARLHRFTRAMKSA